MPLAPLGSFAVDRRRTPADRTEEVDQLALGLPF
jgi:hypothetical protein